MPARSLLPPALRRPRPRSCRRPRVVQEPARVEELRQVPVVQPPQEHLLDVADEVGRDDSVTAAEGVQPEERRRESLLGTHFVATPRPPGHRVSGGRRSRSSRRSRRSRGSARKISARTAAPLVGHARAPRPGRVSGAGRAEGAQGAGRRAQGTSGPPFRPLLRRRDHP